METAAPKHQHQACDACKLRKVKCNGLQRCQQCSHLNLRCVYSLPKPRQRRTRGRLIAQCQEDNGTAGISRTLLAGSDDPIHYGQSPSPAGPDYGISDGVYFESFLVDFEIYVYPFFPFMSVADARRSIATMQEDPDARAFVYALAGVVISLTNPPELSKVDGEVSSSSAQVSHWTTSALTSIRPLLNAAEIDVRRIATVQYLHTCLMSIQRYDMAFYYLRQSVSMLQILRLGDGESLATLDRIERARRQRLYWTVFVHERCHAMVMQKPVVLPRLANLPDFDESIPRSLNDGFLQIIRLFLLVDAEFLQHWFATFDGSDDDLTPEWTERKHREIDAERAGEAEELIGLSDVQRADLIITKQWLRMLVWQIAMSKFLLSTKATADQAQSLLFPVGISTQLRMFITETSKRAIEVHGSGIQQKLFELTDTFASVILTVPAASREETEQRISDFKFLFNFWMSLPRLNAVHKDLLETKNAKLEGMISHDDWQSGRRASLVGWPL